jgi:tRNA (guanine-N7-)-methyltransferase
MPRRALRKIDPALDLARHLLTWDGLPQPWNSVAPFGRVAPLEVEIGSGKGLFLAAAAQQRPEHDFLGVEIAAKYAQFAAARLARLDLPNARVLHANALRLFRELLPEASLAAVHVYFPDPWWKKRHHKRRMMTAEFVAHVARTLRPGGGLHFWTDVVEYFEATRELLAAEPRLKGPFAVPESAPEHDLDYRTHFERRTRLHRGAVYRAEYRRAAGEGESPVANSPEAPARPIPVATLWNRRVP